MLEKVDAVNSVINNFIWGVPAMICIIGVGLFLSFRTRFLQIRKFPYAMKVTFGRMFKKKEAGDGALTPFQAVCTALAATVGTGNVAGVAGAIAIGGPGAIFWMWISALLGMCTKFAEVTLAKFTQNPELKRALLDTGNAVLAEAAVNDKIWGIGLSMSDPKRLDPSEWKGQNLMGYALMLVREKIR